jgi:penicillin-binding protein 2
LSIGQGFILVTPLQLLNAYAAIANSGILYRPQVVQESLDADGNLVKVTKPEEIGRLEISPQNLQLIRAGLYGVINWDNGTAKNYFDVPGIDVSGKTGTAEFCDDYPACLDGEGRVKTSHAWFASYAPTFNPEIVTIVFVYGGGEGSKVAVPVTNKILRHYFNIPDEDEIEDVEKTEAKLPFKLLPETTFIARLLGTDNWTQESAGIFGFVLDEQGRGVGEITVDIMADGQVVIQLMTGQSGQFDYDNLDATEADMWQLRLPDYAGSPVLQLEMTNGLRYLIEFEAEPMPEIVTASGSS